MTVIMVSVVEGVSTIASSFSLWVLYQGFMFFGRVFFGPFALSFFFLFSLFFFFFFCVFVCYASSAPLLARVTGLLALFFFLDIPGKNICCLLFTLGLIWIRGIGFFPLRVLFGAWILVPLDLSPSVYFFLVHRGETRGRDNSWISIFRPHPVFLRKFCFSTIFQECSRVLPARWWNGSSGPCMGYCFGSLGLYC